MAKCNLGKVKFKTMPVSGRPTLRLRGDLFELSAGGASWFALHLLACLLACVKGHFARLFSSLFLGNFACCIIKPVFSVAMSSRQTNNSHSVSLFSDTSQVPVSPSADASSHSSTASTSSPAAAIFPATNVPDPAFLAAVVNAVKVALAAEKTPPSSDSATVPVSVPDPSCSSSLRVSGGVPSQADLGARTATFLSSGLGFSSSQAASPSPASSGRNNYVVPSFVSTFANPSPAVTSSVFALSSLVPATSPCVVSTAPATNLPSGPLLQQPFVVGPGFSPVPAKTVNQIVSGKFVDLSDLLSVNIVHTERESQVLLDGRLVFTPSTKRNRRRVEDISSWCEAFAIFTLIFTSYFPHRWKDLTCYKLLILRTYRQFSGRVWLAYDKAFREHAAAAGIVDWSSMNVQLYNLCAAGASVRGGLDSPFNEFPEPSGAASSQVICRSWNRGRCSAQSAFCRFAHRCSSCGGPHRSRACSVLADNSTNRERKRRSPSPPSSSSSSRSKRR